MSSEFENIPEELRERDQWLMWDGDNDSPRRPHWCGDFSVSWTDPDDWHSFEEAVDAANERESWGIGYVFSNTNENHPRGLYGALDLDGCADPDTGPKDWLPSVQPFFEHGAYMEKSPSGEGIHIPLAGFEEPEWWSDEHFTDEEHEGVEAYGKKFFTFTGDALVSEEFENDTVADTGEWVEDWLAEAYEAITDRDPRAEAVSEAQSRGEDAGNHSAGGSSVGNLGIYDVVSRSEYPTGENAAHPFHSSGTGKNFKVMDGGDSWRCWRHDTGGHAIALVGQEAGLMDCSDNFSDLSNAEQKEVYDAADELGYDVGDRSATDGGTTTANAPVDPPADDSDDDAPNRDTLSPSTVMAVAGLGEDDSLGDLTDREKAFFTWHLIDNRTDNHLLAAVPEGRDNPESVVYRYDSGLWVPSGEQLLRTLGAEALGPQYSENVRRELVEQVRARAAKPRDEFQADRGTIAVQNGLLAVDSRDRRDIEPKDMVLRQLGAAYDADAESPLWQEFLEGVVREGDIETLQEYVGYCLMHWKPPDRMALLLGPQDSGKSTFLNVVRALLGGRDNVSSENLNSLVNTRWGTANIHRKLANITNELETTPLETLGRAKTIAGGGDQITAERKGKDPFQFVPHAKHMFGANRVPPAQDADDAFHERWLHIRFPETIPKSQQVDELDDNIIDEELSGVLNWALEGYDRYVEQGGFSSDPPVGRKRDMWEAYGHSVKRFKHNCLEVTGDSDDLIVKSIGHDFYALFCEEWAGTEIETQTKFTNELTNDSKIGQGRRKVRDGGKQRTVYTGIKFAPQALEELEFNPGAALDDLRGDIDTDTDTEDHQDSLGGYDDG